MLDAMRTDKHIVQIEDLLEDNKGAYAQWNCGALACVCVADSAATGDWYLFMEKGSTNFGSFLAAKERVSLAGLLRDDSLHTHVDRPGKP